MHGTPQSWWAPLWRGLFAEPTGKHYRRLKLALWLLGYLITHADRRTGVVRQRLTTIARGMGISYWTVRVWLRRMRQHGYITVRETGRVPEIQIRKWRPPSRGHAHAPLTGMPMPGRGAKRDPCENGREWRKPFNGAAKP